MALPFVTSDKCHTVTNVRLPRCHNQTTKNPNFFLPKGAYVTNGTLSHQKDQNPKNAKIAYVR
jgi:hypothetical protein